MHSRIGVREHRGAEGRRKLLRGAEGMVWSNLTVAEQSFAG